MIWASVKEIKQSLRSRDEGTTSDFLSTCGERIRNARRVAGSPDGLWLRLSTVDRFELIDEDWYLELPGLPDFAKVKPTNAMLSGMYDGWLQAIQSDAATAESILEQVEQQARTIDTVPPQSGEESSDSEPDG